MLALLREISLRHWIRSPLRSLLVVLGIALGVALYVATGAASRSMSAAFAELVARASGRADLTIQSDSGTITSELVGDVADVPGVAHAAATLEITTRAPDYNESLLILGVDLLGDLHFLPFNVAQGEQRTVEDPLSFVNDPYALLVAKRFAARHGLSTGSKLRLLTSEGPKEFHVRGVLEDSGPAASFGGQVIVMFLDAAQVAFSKGLAVDRIDVAVAPPATVDEVRARLAQRLRPGITVERPDHLTAHLQELVLPMNLALSLSGFIALLVGGFLVYNAVGVAVAQRVREIGVLRALGVTRSRTSRLLCTEAAILAVPAVALGLVLARYMARRSTAEALKLVNRVYLVATTTEPTLTPGLIARGCLAGVATAVLAAWWPARRGAQSDPAIVLRAAASVERSRLN
jgi:putative ABC transport system permease protein